MPNNETIERIAEKLINHVQASVMKVGYCEDADRPVFVAALSEMRTVALREAAESVEKVCAGYIEYANKAPAASREWAKTVGSTALRIRGEASAAILGRIDK